MTSRRALATFHFPEVTSSAQASGPLNLQPQKSKNGIQFKRFPAREAGEVRIGNNVSPAQVLGGRIWAASATQV